ncbi:MAG: 6-carboxytetrahydropterin synthase [Nitrospinae bacterium]|nr:6-carboxytetrahydropterin synthase [Nitrospinota bacterium]
MIYITRKIDFCASHRLFNPAFTDEQNQAVFGPCNNPNGHGHNYTLEVTIKGELNPETGMVLNFRFLKDLIKSEIAEKIDHKNLNLDVSFLAGSIPTVENMAIKIWGILEEKIDHARLHEIKIYESDRNCVTYRGKSK